MKPRLLWITDPWDTLDHPRDSTLRLIEESLALGLPAHWCDVRSIRVEDGAVRLTVQAVLGAFPGRAAGSFKLSSPETRVPSDFQRLHYRVDPPVDLAYLHPLQMLVIGLTGHRSSAIVNPAAILALGNEKLHGMLLADLMPPSFVSSQWEALRAFGQSEGRTVLKPLYEAQSKGIELLDWRASEATELRAKLGALTDDFTRPVLLQRFLPGISEGEQRLWFLDGKLLAFARKRPRAGEFRIDMDQGGTLARTELTPGEKKSATAIGRVLKTAKIRLAAVDLIEGKVTDFNFTSPGLLTPMESILGENLARPIIESLHGRDY